MPAPLRVLAKALLLFVAANLLFAAVQPLPALGRLSLYNTLLPGRARLPYGDDPATAYNLTLDSLDAMFASHEVARTKAGDEYRVVLIGDSATWGWLLRPHETVAGQLNALQLRKGGKRMVFYNLGYPGMSLAKDVLILERALSYQPDQMLWLTTLESWPSNKQATHPLVFANGMEYWGMEAISPPLTDPRGLSDTIWGQRRAIADVLRLQLYGVMWAATGVDQTYPAQVERAANDQTRDAIFVGLSQSQFTSEELALDLLEKGARLAQARGVPLMIVNEPTLISTGANSDVRFNFFYPRWAYDQYRVLLADTARANGVPLLDVWNLLPVSEFTNTAVHTTPAGAKAFAQRIAEALR